MLNGMDGTTTIRRINMLHRGNKVDIERTYNGLTLSAIVDGRYVELEINDPADAEALYSMLSPIVNQEYTDAAMRDHADYEITGC